MINYNSADFAEEVQDITKGRGVDVAYDSVGQATYPKTLTCLKRFGLFVSFGQSSGVIKTVTMADLQKMAPFMHSAPPCLILSTPATA